MPDPVDEVIALMKPWYDHYCFAPECIGTTMYNSDMVLYFLNTYLLRGVAPSEMIDRNIRTDYSKLRHFIRIDKMQKEGRSVITELIEQGEISGNIIKDSFPADRLADAGNFTSLLYYFGMIEKGVIKISNDGVNWEIVEKFIFGNLINNPVKRYHYFKKPVISRYIRMEAIEIAANGKIATMAEIDLF